MELEEGTMDSEANQEEDFHFKVSKMDDEDDMVDLSSDEESAEQNEESADLNSSEVEQYTDYISHDDVKYSWSKLPSRNIGQKSARRELNSLALRTM